MQSIIAAARRPSVAAALLLFATFLGASAILLRFLFWGSFTLVLPVQSPVNAESILTLAFLLSVFLRMRSPADVAKASPTLPHTVYISLVAIAAFAPFLITMNDPFVADSNAHILAAATRTFQQTLTFFSRPSGADLFFRPFGYLAYWLDFKWAGYDPFRWHLGTVVLHALNSCLVYVLATRLIVNRFASGVAALVFALHGSRAEAVSWVGAQFDLLACFFALLTLLSLDKSLHATKWTWRLAAILTALLAVFSKESAYCLPLLALGMLPFQPPARRKDLLHCSAILFAVCGAAFLYRSWVLHGLGGYRGANGESALQYFSLIRTIKPLLFRQWALLFFPINWSAPFSAWMKVAIIVMLIAMLALIVWSNARRPLLLAAILLVFLADVPVHHLLLMTADLAGSRVLYLPVLGLALFWGLLVQGCERASTRSLLAAALLLFQLAALTHNLITWRNVAFLAQRICRDFAAETANSAAPLRVIGLPGTWRGVFFLQNAFPECVQINSRQAAPRIYVEPDQRSSGPTRVFLWNSRTQRLEPANGSTAGRLGHP